MLTRRQKDILLELEKKLASTEGIQPSEFFYFRMRLRGGFDLTEEWASDLDVRTRVVNLAFLQRH